MSLSLSYRDIVLTFSEIAPYTHEYRLVKTAGVVPSSNGVQTVPDSKVYGANIGPTWGRQYPGGPHVGPMNLAIWGILNTSVPIVSSESKLYFELFMYFASFE